MASITESKVAFITGAARRIGAEIAQTLHAAGYRIVIHYRSSQDEAMQLQQSLNAKRADSCLLVQGDLLAISTLPQLINIAIQWAGRLDVLVNNASSFYPTPLDSLTEAQFDDLIGTNFKAPLFLTQAAAPYLQQTNGCIVNMVDIHGFRPLKNYAAYGAAKAGLWMLTQILARDLGPEVRVNGIAPGAILWPELPENQSTPEEIQQELLVRTALKRKGNPDDIAQTVLFLVQNAHYITGHIIPVDGGRMLNN